MLCRNKKRTEKKVPRLFSIRNVSKNDNLQKLFPAKVFPVFLRMDQKLVLNYLINNYIFLKVYIHLNCSFSVGKITIGKTLTLLKKKKR